MKLHNLKASEGATKAPKRKGRGTASGNGTTAGRGMNGQNSRSGGGVRLGFEGGQMPLYRRLPKRGFTNIWKKEMIGVNVSALNIFEDGTTVTVDMMESKGLANGMTHGVKILGNGTLEKKITVQAHKFSKAAIEKIEAAGGKAQVI